MAEGSGGLGHIVTPADRLARIAHDPQHVSERQQAASARPFSTVSVHRAIARLIENRGPHRSVSGSLVLQYAKQKSA
jgi:hypothetical protein